ncbi:hypothetical protein N7510_007935 [Penicillium lagena]|uniref:uncharacterized protein n=1 Tax=Penicillium lagena TaxID=94218 RepID=UPI0025401F14|nr:uncharacterized protein N7510_007935 [Penicillium lagena]KAJ5611216.1 hypothetical protein N7510_007935 [Penicillium lagena]
MLVPISTCLGQFKWKQNIGQEQTPVQLYHFDMLDKASRGPWGALEVLWHMPGSLPMAGAILMILSLAIDPFSQQILAFPSREVVARNEKTSFIQDYKENFNYDNQLPTDPTLQIAILNGLAQSYDPLEPRCSTPNCTFPDFATLGVCSHCMDVTEKSIQSCHSSNGTSMGIFLSTPINCSYTSPNGLQIKPDYLSMSSTTDSLTISHKPWYSNTSGVEFSRDPISSDFVSLLSAQYFSDTNWTSVNRNEFEPKPTLTECSVYPCEKQFTNVTYLNSDTVVPNPSQSQRLVPDSGWSLSDVSAGTVTYLQYRPVKGAATYSENSNYTIDKSTISNMIPYLADLFSDDESTAALILSNNSQNRVAELFDSMATSMTDLIRTSANSIRIEGTAYRTETFIHVRWPWIIFPILLVMLSIVLLIIAFMINRDQPVLWKSSIFPFLLGKLELRSDTNIMKLRRLNDLQSESKKVKVVVCDHDDVLSFIDFREDHETEEECNYQSNVPK